MPVSTLQNYCYPCPCPCSESQPPAAGSVGNPPIQAGRSDPGSYEVTTFPPGFSRPCMCLYDLVCALQEWNLFSPVLWKSCDQTQLPSNQMLWGHFL